MIKALKQSALITLIFVSTNVLSAPVPIKAMTAAYLYNFMLFTEWENKNNSEIRLCVVGDNTLGQSLYELEGKQIKSYKTVVKDLTINDSTTDCDLLFISSELDEKTVASIVDDVKVSPVLTVSDSQYASKTDVMISLFVEKHRLAFAIDKNQAEHAGIKFSSKLLRLASRVIE
jgi:hypothetical protein